MTHDDEDVLAKVPLHTWRVPPSTVDRGSLLARALAPAATAKRARGAWLLAAMAFANVVLATLLIIIFVMRPSPSSVTVRPAGGSTDDKTTELLIKLTQEQLELENKLLEIQQLRSTIEDLVNRAHDCDQTVKHEPSPVVPRPPPPVETTPQIAGCDEVSCVLNNYEGTCCLKYKRQPGLPESLDRAAISSGVAAVKSQVAACGGKTKGIVKLHVRVAPAGKVTNVDVESTPDAALGACVAAAVQRAAFAQTQQGGSFSYPFVF